MRIRKRSILPFLLSSPPRFPSNLSSPRNPYPQRRGEAKQQGLKEADSKEGDEEAGDPEEEKVSKERPRRQIDHGRCIRIHCPENGPGNGGLCGATTGKETHEMKECCTLSLPVLGRVEDLMEKEAAVLCNFAASLQALQEKEEERRSAREKGSSERNGYLKHLAEEKSFQASGRWDERERVFPLKKRKESFPWRDEDTVTESEEEKQKSSKKRKVIKRKITTKMVIEEEETDQLNSATKSHVKKVKGTSNGALMEGSRCSRINGRGWRCCQQTLVGYSLCEHHLGKGRLRSMSTLPRQAEKGRSGSTNNNTAQGTDENSRLVSTTHKSDEMKMNEKKKIGMVKARSISSLLGLSSSTMIAAMTII